VVHDVERSVGKRQVVLKVPQLNGLTGRMKIEIYPMRMKSLSTTNVEVLNHVGSGARI